MKPPIRSRRLSLSTSPFRLWAEDAVGYRPDDDVADWQRVVFKAVVAVGAIAVCVLTVWMLNRGELPRIPENTSSILRLDEFTRHSDRTVRNTTPAFLELPGAVGALSADGRAIHDIDENELRNVVCAPTLAVLVRQEFPGYYERIPDEQLEHSVLANIRSIATSSARCRRGWTPRHTTSSATQMKPPPLRASVVLWSMFLMAAFVVVAEHFDYRLLVPLAEHAHGHTPMSSFQSSGRA
jgi:hypothetical protein